MNCKHCHKPFTCGCQKANGVDGSVIHKTCVNEYNRTKNIVANDKAANLSLEIARQKIVDLTNK
jgi:hypothetical protein|tara:strand:+ start:5018 stop:5209 length:192 start_codon:yes stop_codon:yes gene_type:complete